MSHCDERSEHRRGGEVGEEKASNTFGCFNSEGADNTGFET